ncbi:MAG: PF00070 family, FAD-dependent NAD(P)-disulphide oxidoreductase [uncultured Paraburkholderia sp.]|nr:MAG: PF00070 family, FAD-dependent NAD(P)-disulphide oxidoreductase [uncultured Paraburkholderia sp.]
MAQHFDAVVIGTGQGGRRTAVVERAAFGGTCVNVGCTPTKAYVASARAAHVVRHAARLGVLVSGAVNVDLSAVKARKDKIKIIGQSRDGVEQWLRGTENVTVFNGHARFTEPHTLSISGADGTVLHELSAGEIFLNTGTRAVVPPLEGIERIRYYTNSSLLELTELPSRLVIVGGSYIALEFAQVFRRFGSEVTVLVRGDRVLTREDADLAESVQKVLAREGVEFRFGVQPSRVGPHPHRENEVCIGFEQNVPALEASHLLFATGRALSLLVQYAMHIHPTISELIPTLLDGLKPLK